ncbi:hypothetical protein lerEdw1_014514 [Lerista edwardsae]|nr:hypothetical protein lerEdw1_014514 [Lerista edwardsae]
MAGEQKQPEPLLTLNVATWNVRGLRMRDRREEVLASLERLRRDVVVLQELHFRSEREACAARWAWMLGRSFWSFDPEGVAGVAVLFRNRPDLTLERWVEVVPGRLVLADFRMEVAQAGGRPVQRRFRLCALYAPVQAGACRALWARLKDHARTGRSLLIMGDFNVRADPADRVPKVAGAEPPPLKREERELQDFHTGLPLDHLGLRADARLDFYPLSCRATFARTHLGRLSGRNTYYGPGSAGSSIDRVWGAVAWAVRASTIWLTPWSDHGLLALDLVAGPWLEWGRRPPWRLRAPAFRQQEYQEAIE